MRPISIKINISVVVLVASGYSGMVYVLCIEWDKAAAEIFTVHVVDNGQFCSHRKADSFVRLGIGCILEVPGNWRVTDWYNSLKAIPSVVCCIWVTGYENN